MAVNCGQPEVVVSSTEKQGDHQLIPHKSTRSLGISAFPLAARRKLPWNPPGTDGGHWPSVTQVKQPP
ncbi:hypothetical protein EJB05_55418, partial [Eragrostis curvula]